jgi:DNA-binding LacI/PurR family transcriptional regulator
VDHRALGEDGTLRLLARGCRRPGIVYRREAVWAGAQAGLRHASAGEVDALSIPFTRQMPAAELAAAIRQADADGLFFSEDRTALAALKALAENGDAPTLPVVSHANAGEDILPAPVERLEIDGHEVGSAAVAMVRGIGQRDLPERAELRIKPHLRADVTTASAAPVEANAV